MAGENHKKIVLLRTRLISVEFLLSVSSQNCLLERKPNSWCGATHQLGTDPAKTLKTAHYTSVTSSSLAGRKVKRTLILICLWKFWLFRIIDMSLETISDHFPLSAEACGGKQRPGLAAGLSPAELSIRAVHSSNRCFCFLRSVGTSLNIFFLVGANANIAEIQQFDLSLMLLLESIVTGYPIVHSQVISRWLLILYLLFHA